MKSPENIHKLIALLSESSKKDYNSIFNNFNFECINFKPFESWSPKKYTRNCLYKDHQFELILLCWNENQATSIHGHDGEDCWVYLLEGSMEEVYYTLTTNNDIKEEGSHHLLPKQLSFMNDRIGLHKLKNTYKGKSLSLHLYAKPIENCRSYDEASKTFIERELKYDTFREVELVTKSN
ncbi:cysteine dioxygenase family protein [uncultured Psychroserpens sp.]|uniref:cysteine dioxygenase n=1 Tax=uncultured Psychroserpens sp. TaxID=255436 RepID=UPI0026052EBB|nr:cysteine dioxygenase family protein [uncultured Psychroserpens sp.]